MEIREYRPEDCRELAALFYDTVHEVNAADYTKEQPVSYTHLTLPTTPYV